MLLEGIKLVVRLRTIEKKTEISDTPIKNTSS